jgi:hypothetical protein
LDWQDPNAYTADMIEQRAQAEFPLLRILVTAALSLSSPFLILIAAVFEQHLLGTYNVSKFCHAVGIAPLIDWLYWQLIA